MAQIIELEGNVARIVERTISYECPLDQIASLLVAEKPIITGALPSNLAFMVANGLDTFYVIEVPPSKEHLRIVLRGTGYVHQEDYRYFLNDFERGERTVSDCDEECEPFCGIEHESDDLDDENFPTVTAVFPVSVPWQYWIFCMRDQTGGSYPTMRFTIGLWSNDRITSLDEPLYPMTIPNMNGQGYPCWGDTGTGEQTVRARIDDLVNNFYSSDFNCDYGPNSGGFETLSAWADASKLDGIDFVMPMYNSSTTLRHNIDTPEIRDASNIVYPARPPLPTTFENRHDFRAWWADLPQTARTIVLDSL